MRCNNRQITKNPFDLGICQLLRKTEFQFRANEIQIHTIYILYMVRKWTQI